jgi:hypothetical protein
MFPANLRISALTSIHARPQRRDGSEGISLFNQQKIFKSFVAGEISQSDLGLRV